MSKRKRREPPPLPELFTDRNLGSNVVPSALEACGFTVYPMLDFYGPDLPEVDDASWIEEVTEQGLVILTKDKRIRRHEREREAVIASRARMFRLTSGGLTGRQMAERLVANRHRITQRSQHAGPYIYAVHRERLEKLL